MFHVKQFYLVVLFFTVVSSKGQGTLTIQDKPFVIDRTIDSSIWRQLKTSPLFQTLTEREQLMFYWTNYMRKDPKRFYNTIVKEFVRQFPEANSSEVKTLAKDVEEIKTELPFLMPDKGLLSMSKLHSKDLQSRGNTISHTSSKGKTFVERVREAGIYTCAADNVYIGNADPLQTLISCSEVVGR